MATERMIRISPLLCFALNSYKRHPLKLLKSTISDYYDAESIAIAKDTIVSDIDNIKLENWKPSTKRRGENKAKQELDDIMTAISFVDENSSFNNLPRYVVENLDDVPVMRMERGELAILLAKLDKIEEGVSNFKLSHANEEAILRSSQQIERVSSMVDQLSSHSQQAGRTVGLQCPNTTGSGKPVRHSRQQSMRDSQLTMEYETTDGASDGGGTWYDVTRKKRKASQLTPPTSNVNKNNPNESSHLWSDRVSNSQPVRQQTLPKKKSVRVIGKAPATVDNTDHTKGNIKSAKPYVKKKVFAIYNVDTAESVSSIENFIETSCGAKPITCFQVKSRDDEKSSAFRVCIDDSISDKFLDPSLWANGIIIKQWTFKPKETANAPGVSDKATVPVDTENPQ